MNIVILWELNGIKSTEKQYIITVYQIDTNSISVQAWNLHIPGIKGTGIPQQPGKTSSRLEYVYLYTYSLRERCQYPP